MVTGALAGPKVGWPGERDGIEIGLERGAVNVGGVAAHQGLAVGGDVEEIVLRAAVVGEVDQDFGEAGQVFGGLGVVDFYFYGDLEETDIAGVGFYAWACRERTFSGRRFGLGRLEIGGGRR